MPTKRDTSILRVLTSGNPALTSFDPYLYPILISVVLTEDLDESQGPGGAANLTT